MRLYIRCDVRQGHISALHSPVVHNVSTTRVRFMMCYETGKTTSPTHYTCAYNGASNEAKKQADYYA